MNKKQKLVLAVVMFIYATALLVTALWPHPSPFRVYFVTTILNAVGFFIAVVALLRTRQN